MVAFTLYTLAHKGTLWNAMGTFPSTIVKWELQLCIGALNSSFRNNSDLNLKTKGHFWILYHWCSILLRFVNIMVTWTTTEGHFWIQYHWCSILLRFVNTMVTWSTAEGQLLDHISILYIAHFIKPYRDQVHLYTGSR